MLRLPWILGLLAFAFVSGCGGGNGSTTPVQTLKSASAPQQPYTVPSKTLSATYNGVTYTATYSETPDNGTSMFNGRVANSSSVTITVSGNGQQLTFPSTEYYTLNPYSPLGLLETVSGTTYEFRIMTYNPLPATITVGDSGTLDSGNFYVQGNANPVGSLTETWTVAARDASTVLFSVTGTGTLNGVASTSTVNYSVDANGNIAIVSVTVTLTGGGTLTFT